MNLRKVARLIVSIGWVLVSAGLTWPQEFSKADRGRVEDMLLTVASDVKNHYYDPNLHGLNWDAIIQETIQAIENAPSLGMALSHVAAAMDALHDSHTNFYPPARLQRIDFGFQYQMFGDRCFVTQVKPKSDAESKGIKPGDEILMINGVLPERRTLQKMEYVLRVLRPQTSLRLLLQLPVDGSSREVEVFAKVRMERRITDLSWSLMRERENYQNLLRIREREIGNAAVVIKLPVFAFSNSEIASLVGKARKQQTLILDVRNNSGGSLESLKYLLEAILGKEAKIADRVRRKRTETLVAKARHDAFRGKVIVLVDSQSASAAEMLARVIQIEERGVVVGDRTAGSVMEANFYVHQSGGSLVNFYGASVSEADLIMSDGKSLEHVGVVPDELILANARDLASGRDPVLARAVELAAARITPEEAGKMFPYEWPVRE